MLKKYIQEKKHGEFASLFRRFFTLDVLSHQMFCPYMLCLIRPFVHTRLSHYTFCLYMLCCIIPFVLLRFVSLDVLPVYVLSHYTFYLFRRFVCIHIVSLDILSLYLLSLYILSFRHYVFLRSVIRRVQSEPEIQGTEANFSAILNYRQVSCNCPFEGINPSTAQF